MTLDITPAAAPLGATVRGVDLTAPLTPETVAEIRSAWLAHKVLAFPDQPMTDDDLERFTLEFGPFGDDPYFEAIEGHPHIAAIHRAAEETSPIFAESWHADWTFQEFPPDGTCLLSRVVPSAGGDTHFADQHAVYEALPPDLRAWADDAVVIHSAQLPYAPDGMYGDNDAPDRAMKIVTDDSAYATETHRLVRVHAETGARTLYGCLGYIIGVEGEDGLGRLPEIQQWQQKPEFHYVHRWQPDMLVMWDNRCVLHRATGGYDGHERLLHRTTIGYNASVRADA